MPARIYLPDKICQNCNKAFNRGFLRSGRREAIEDFVIRKFCARICSIKYQRGENHHNYKDGIRRGHDFGYLRNTEGQYIHRIMMGTK